MPAETIKKMIICIIGIITLTVLNGKITHSTLSRTGIVVGLGIDYEDGYVMTAQMVLPGGSSDGSGGSNKFVTIVGKGATLTDCVAEVKEKSGVNPGFRHSAIVLFGNSLLKENKQNYCVEYLFENDLIPDDVSLAVTRDDSAGNVICAQAPMTTISAFQLAGAQNSFAPSLGTISCDVRKCMALIRDENAANTLPVVDVLTSTSVIGGSQNDGEDQHLFSMTTAVTFNGKERLELSPEQTRGYSLVTDKLSDGSFETQENGRTLGYRVDFSKGDVSVKADEGIVEFSVNLQVVLLGIKDGENNSLDFSDFRDGDLETLRNTVEDYVLDCFNACRDRGLDVFNVGQKLRAEISELPDDYLNALRPEVKVKIKIK